ncbi:hypothetical protein ACFQ1L_26330 [Phytohabitans flavus]|uniref:hypothetical protein n=1 Tax=Phytohabitans flavus TaxID=1076124 RepID=UPI003639D232
MTATRDDPFIDEMPTVTLPQVGSPADTLVLEVSTSETATAGVATRAVPEASWRCHRAATRPCSWRRRATPRH